MTESEKKVEYWKLVYVAALHRNLSQKTAEEQAWRAIEHLRNFMKSWESK